MAKQKQATAGIPLWPTQTVTFNQITITVERKTVGHQLLEARVMAALSQDGDTPERTFRNLYAQTVAQTIQVDGLLLPWPGHDATPEEWQVGYQTFLRLDAVLHDLWWKAMMDVNAPYTPQEFWPSHLLTESERKNQASAGSSGNATSGAASPGTVTDGTDPSR